MGSLKPAPPAHSTDWRSWHGGWNPASKLSTPHRRRGFAWGCPKIPIFCPAANKAGGSFWFGCWQRRLYTMTNRASGRSAAFLAIVLLLGFAGASHAGTGAGGVWIPLPEPRAEIKMVAADQLSDADRAVSEPAQTVQSTTVTAPTSQPDAQA